MAAAASIGGGTVANYANSAAALDQANLKARNGI